MRQSRRCWPKRVESRRTVQGAQAGRLHPPSLRRVRPGNCASCDFRASASRCRSQVRSGPAQCWWPAPAANPAPGAQCHGRGAQPRCAPHSTLWGASLRCPDGHNRQNEGRRGETIPMTARPASQCAKEGTWFSSTSLTCRRPRLVACRLLGAADKCHLLGVRCGPPGSASCSSLGAARRQRPGH